MKQLNWDEADAIAAKIALQAMGFSNPRTIARELGMTAGKAQELYESVLAMAKSAAYLALEASGVLDDYKAIAARRLDAECARINAKERAIKARL